jgi:hypothetical protein
LNSLLTTWTAVTATGLACGFFIGKFLDYVSSQVSYHESYAPHELLRWTMLIAAPLSFVFAACVAWNDAPTSWYHVVRRVFGIAALAMGTGVCIATLSAAAVKLQLVLPPSTYVYVPLARVWFCQGLVGGTLYGGMVAFSWSVWRECRSIIRSLSPAVSRS